MKIFLILGLRGEYSSYEQVVVEAWSDCAAAERRRLVLSEAAEKQLKALAEQTARFDEHRKISLLAATQNDWGLWLSTTDADRERFPMLKPGDDPELSWIRHFFTHESFVEEPDYDDFAIQEIELDVENPYKPPTDERGDVT